MNSQNEDVNADDGAIETTRFRGTKEVSEMGKPLITIITSTYNAAGHLPSLIKSIRQQTYGNIEWIVVDGASTDGTLDILQQNEDVIDHWVSEPDKGIYDAWNKGVRLAHGEWICFLGADDFLWDDQVMACIASQLVMLAQNIRVAYGRVILVAEDGKNIGPVGEPWEKIKGRLWQAMCLPHQGVMHRRSLFEQYGEFDESFRIAGDYEFLLRELGRADAFFMPNIIVAGMRQGGVSSNPKNSTILLLEARRAQKLHGRRWPGLIWVSALVRSYIRKWLVVTLGGNLTSRLLDLYRRILGLPTYWTKL
jgi:glycosyltransferase involved in cell wall biosynthesis